MRSHQICAWRLRSSISVKDTPAQKLFFTNPTVRSTLPLVCGVYALQTRGATPMDAIKSANRGVKSRNVVCYFQQDTIHPVRQQGFGQPTKVFKRLHQTADQRGGITAFDKDRKAHARV